MSESVRLPALGESVTEGTVTRWLKAVGEPVEIEEPLLEVSTDKVDTEIPSPFSGVLEQILVQEDETVAVGTVLAIIGDGSALAAAAPAAAEPEAAASAETAAASPELSAEPAPEPAPAPTATPPAAATQSPEDTPAATKSPSTSSGPIYVTPIVRKMAREHGVDLHGVTGTGPGGRVSKHDVVAARTAAQATTATAAAAPQPGQPAVSPLRGTTQPMTRLRKVIAQRAVASMQSTAQLTTVVEVDVTGVALLRDRVKADFLARTGNKLSFLPFFARAAVEALRTYPVINASVDGDAIVYPDHENLSIAVDSERGLFTPVIRDASALTIAELAARIADLAARTRDNTLKPDELSGGTFTLTNTGSRGALFDTPVVFLPQAAILGTGIVAKKPAVVSVDGFDAISIRSTVYLALSYDHRIVDGADAARYLSAVKNRLEAADFEGVLGLG